MRNKGGVVVTAGGNAGTYYAGANTDTMITVSATDSADQRASWSTYGPSIDVAAPGVGIWTTVLGGGYGAVNGTSFSSPLTAGVVALMLSANPKLQASQVDTILRSTADDLGTPGRDDYFGAGRINAARAVAAAKAAVTADTLAPTVAITSPGATVKGIVAVSAAASDNVGVNRVELYAGGVLVGTDTVAPYGFSWNSATRADGATTLVAKAYDTAGNAASSTVNVTVANNTVGTTDVTPPVLAIAHPLNGVTVGGTVGITVTASDNVALASASLYIDGALVTTGNGSFSYNWNSRKVVKGMHSIQAVARDGAGNTTTKTIQVVK
jgi:thermitase